MGRPCRVCNHERSAEIGRDLLHGLLALGAPQKEAWRLITLVAVDCIPDVRRRVLRFLYAHDHPQPTTDVALAIDYPTITTRRACEDLAAHGILTRRCQKGKADTWELSSSCHQLFHDAGSFSEMWAQVNNG
jgi:hypothetical protein